MNKKEMRRRNREKRKHRTVKEMMRERRSLLTDQEVFSSPEVSKYIRGKVKLVTKEFGRKAIPVRVFFDPYFKGVAATNNEKILINAGHPLFEGTREEKFRMILGAAAHEVSHYLFTNFTSVVEWQNGIKTGTLVPAFPTFDGTEIESKSILLENSRKVKDFLEGKIGCTKSSDPAFTNREWLSRAGFQLMNILEDGRIENIFSMYCTNHRTLYYGLVDLIDCQRKQCPSLPKLLDLIGEGTIYEYEALQSVLLHYVRFGEVQGYVHKEHKDEPIIQSFSKVVPYIDDYLEAMDSYTSLTCLNKIIITLWPDIEKLIDIINEGLDQAGLPQEAGPEQMTLRSAVVKGQTDGIPSEMTGEGTDGAEFNKAKPGANKSPCPRPSEAKKEAKGGDSETETSKGSPSPTSGEGEESESKGEGSGEKAESKEDGEEDSKSSGEKADATGETPKTSEVEESEAKGGSSGSTEDTGTDSEGKAKPSESSEETSDRSNPLEGEVERINPFTRTSELLDEVNSSSDDTDSELKVEEKSNVELDLNSLAERIAQSMNEELERREIQKDFEDMNSDIDYGDIHRGIGCSFVRHNVTEANRSEYNYNKQTLEKLVKEMMRKSSFLETEENPLEFRNKYSGRRFNASATAKKDYRFFSREAHIEPNYELDVVILCDESGSMRGQRIEACKATALCCYEFMQRACGPGHVAVYGHSTGPFGYSASEGHVKLFCYADFDNPDENDKYRIMNMSAGGSNRDGYALRYVKEKIAERDAERKLIITISDGQPADMGYGGMDAVRDIQGILRECERENIMYIAAAIGSDLDVIKGIYGEKHFLDIANLQELPNKLMGLIARLLK